MRGYTRLMRLRLGSLALCLAALFPSGSAAQQVTLFQEKTSTNAASIAGTNWTTPTNIQTANDAYAGYLNTAQNWLISKDWSWDLPEPVVIHGIMLVIQGNSSGSTAARRRFNAGLTKDGAATVGTLVTADLPLTTDADMTLSTAAALWGTTWSEAELESANWGVMLRDANTNGHQLSFDTMTVTVAFKTVDQVTSTPTAVIPGSVPQNSVFAALKLDLGTNRNTALLTSVRVSTTGTLNPILVSSVTLYLDDGDGSFDAGDTLVSYSTNSFNSVGNVDLRLASPQTLTTTGQTYFVVLGMLSTTTIGGTIGVSVQFPSALFLSNPDTVTTTNFPAASGNATVTDGADTITVTPTSQAPANANQGTSFSVLRLAMLTDLENAQLSALTVTKSGTLADSGVSAVNLYRDFNANGTYDAGTDTLVGGPATFSGGTASLTVSPVATLITASTNYFVVYTLAATATPGATVGGSVQANTDLTLTAPDVTRTTNFPAASSNVTVVDVPDAVTVAKTDLAPANVVQGSDYAVEQLSLTTGGDEAVWTAVTVTKTGTLADNKVTTVKIYLDTGNGTYGGEDTLVSPGVTTFSGGSAAITLSAAQTITTSAKVYYIVYTLDATATPTATIGAQVTANTALTLTAPDTVTTTNFPVNSSNSTVLAIADTVTASRVDLAPGTLAQGTANTAMMRLSLVTNTNTASWTDVVVSKTGTLADSGVSTVKIYRDANANGTFEAGSDTLISPAVQTFTSGAAAITLDAPETITTTPKLYFVVYSLATNPTPGATIGAEVTVNSDLTVTSPDTTATTNFPLTSSNATVTDVADTLTVTPTALSPGTVAQSSDYATQKLSLAVNQDFTVWSALTVTKTGTLADSDIDTVKVYLDDGDDSYDAGDALVSPGVTTFSGGSAAITLSAAQTITTTPQVYFIVYTLDLVAAIGNTVGSQVANAAALTVSGTDSTASTNLPASSGNSTVTDAADTVTVSPTALAPGSVAQGAAYAVERFSLVTNQETATWTGLQVSTTGTLDPILVSSVTVYLDDGDNTFNAGDTLISPAVTTFTDGAADVALSAAQTINTTPKVYFVVYGLVSTATVGGTVGATFASPGKFTLSGVDAVSASNFPTASGDSTLTDRGDDVVVTPTDLGGGEVGQGETHACLKLSLFTPLDASTWTAVTVSTIGNLSPASIDSARIYLDDGDGVFDAGLDTLISPGVTTFTGGSAAITLSAAQIIDGTAKDYFVVLVVNVAATIGNTTGVRIHEAGQFTFSAPDPSSGTFPVSGTVSTVAAPDIVTGSRTSMAPELIGQGAGYATQRLSFVTDGNNASMTAIRVTKAGTINRSNISSVKIYFDADGNGYFDDNDTSLGSGVFPAGGAVTITLSPAQTLSSTPKDYFVVYNLTVGAVIGATAGSSLAAATDVTIASPDTMATTNFPLASSLSAVQAADYGVLLDQSLINVGSAAIDQDYLVTTPVVVLSTGNIGATFAVRAATVTGGSPWTIQTAPGLDQFTAHGLFNSAQPVLGDFGASDILSDSDTTCLAGKFVGDQDCRVVRAGDTRKLWIKLGLPTLSTTELDQDIQVTVTATVP